MTSVIITAVVFAFVFGVLGLAGYALYECMPFARHDNPYRDSATGRRYESPHVDEFRDYC